MLAFGRQPAVLKRFFFVTAWMSFVVLTLSAQEKKPSEDVLRIDTDLVMIEVTATDKRGNYVRDLTANDFRLFVDGQQRKIDFFSVTNEIAPSRPLAVVFALDLSGSLKPDEIATLRASALKFTELMKGESVFAALGFNYEVKVFQEFTPEQKKLERAFAKMEHFGGSTRIYDALDKAVLMLSRRAHFSKSNKPLRRVIVVITDGFDSSSMVGTRELIQRANAAGVTVYSITLPSYILSASRNTERVITPLDASRIVAATGGRDFAANARDFAPVFKALAEEIRASYGVAYYPEMRDGKQHEVRVEPVNAALQLRSNRTIFTAPVK
jgi:Ca-activated chloride channel family protein